MEQAKNPLTYDYLSYDVKKEMENVYIDIFKNLGWEFIGSEIGILNTGININTKLNFKRDRKIAHKTELNSIKTEIEQCFFNIEKLTKNKYILPSIYAYSIGILGTILVALSVFAVTGYLNLNMIFSTLLGIIGIALWIPPYFLYKNVLKEQDLKARPLIDNEYDKIDELCNKANKLIMEKE